MLILTTLVAACAPGASGLRPETDPVGERRLEFPVPVDQVWSTAVRMLVLEGAYISQCDVDDDGASIAFLSRLLDRPAVRVDFLIRPTQADRSKTEVVASASPLLAAEAALEKLRGAMQLVRYDWLR